MSTSVPWSVKGIDRKSRETAKDLARRSGMTLGEWLNHVIEYQGEGKVTPLPQTATLNEAIERLTSRIAAVETRSSLAVTGIDQSVRGLAARIDTSENTPSGPGGNVADALKSLEASLGQIASQVYANEAAQKASLAEIRDELSRMARKVEASDAGAVEKRLTTMESQVRHAEQRSTKGIEGIGAQIVLMAETVQRQVEGIDHRTSAAVQRVEGDVARIADQIDGRLRQADEAQAAALEKLGGEIERITARLSERISQTPQRAFSPFEPPSDGGEPSPFASRIRQSEERTVALLDEARETIEHRLEEIAPHHQEPHVEALVEAEPAEAFAAEDQAETHDHIEAHDGAEDDEFVQPAAAHAADLDPFAISETDDPFAESAAEPALASADVAAAPVIYPAADETRTDYAFAPHDFEIVGDESATEAEADAVSAEAKSFETVEFEAADPFAADDEFETEAAVASDPFAVEAEAEAQAEVEHEGADPFAASHAEALAPIETIDDEAVDIHETVADPFAETTDEAEAFEPGPFGHAHRAAEDHALEHTDGHAEEPVAELADEPVAEAETETHEPAQPISYLERARAAAQQAAQADQRSGKGGFNLRAFGFGNRRRGGAKLKSGLLMSTAVLICLGSGLAGAAMLAPLLRETGTKLSEAKGAKPNEVKPQAAMMTNPQPITPEIGAPVVAPTAEAKAVDPSAALTYAESLSLLSAKDKRGVELLQKAANQGYPQAELQLGHLYETGFPGLQSDLTQARKWTEKAAEAGLPSAMHNLAMLIYNGEGGPKSPTLAAQWFRQAAEQGQVDSQFNLGLLYENGKGVQANPAEAYKWFLLASRSGDAGSRAQAAAAAQRVRPLISAEAQAAAERAAQAYGATQQATAN